MEANELIERYVNEVGQNLPRRMRSDIELELSSLLHDALEERAAAAGTGPTQQMAADILREFGKPEEMAASYLPDQYLVGPHLFPTYRLVLTIVLAIVGVGFGIGLVFILFRTGRGDLASSLWNWFTELARSLVFNAGLVTVIFAVLERIYARQEQPDAGETPVWDPLQLPAVKDPDRVNRGEVAVGIVFTVFVIVLFNFFPEWIGVITFSGDDVSRFSLLVPEFRVHIPWLTALWSLEVVMKLVVLRQGRWQRPTRWAEFGLGLFSLYIAYRIFTGGPVFTISILNTLLRIAIGIGLFFGSLESIGRLYRLLFGRPFSPTNTIKSRLA